MKTVAVIEGFSGGPKHTAQFRQALTQAGFKVIKNPQEADIVVAHSAGIYAVPLNTRAKLLILIGPTYWPGRRLIKRARELTRQASKYYVNNHGWGFYLRKKAWEVYYFFIRHKYLWLGIFHNNKLEFFDQLADGKRNLVFIRNDDDAYTGSTFKNAVSGWKNTKYIELPGIHDDYTVNPEPYIKIIKEAA
jgi:hypothetical protein